MRGGMTRKVISAILTIAMTVGAVPTDGIAYALAAGADAGGAAAASAQPTDANDGGTSDLGGAAALAEDLKTATENATRAPEVGAAPVADIATTVADATDAQEEPQRVKVRLDANGGEGEASETEAVLDGAIWTMPENPFSREGYRFVGWNTTTDGKDVADDPATEGDEATPAIAVADRQEAVNLKITVQTEDGAVVEHDLGECVRDGLLTLYAQWEKVDADKEADASDSPAASEDVPATTDSASPADNALAPATGTEQGSEEEKDPAAEDTETEANTGATLSSTLDSALGGEMGAVASASKTSPLARKLAGPLMAPAMGSLTTQSSPTGSREGTAYAVLDSAGTLTLFRSTNSYTAGENQTVTDIMGNTYTGQVYTGVENTATTYNSVPWYNQRSSVKLARIADGQVISPVSCAYWFYQCSNMTAFEGAEGLDTSAVTSMYGMFNRCKSLTEPPSVGGWDTSAVTSMSYMFNNCSAMTVPPAVGSWSTSAVTSMSEMFESCTKMTEPPAVGNWSTGAVTSMYGMFYGCSTMTEPPAVGSWNTGAVTSMGSMFSGCSAMTEPPSVGGWDTGAVTSMGYMFNGCSAMTEPPAVGGWDTGKVTSMYYMFSGCSAMTSLDVSSWGFAKVTKSSNYLGLQNCSALMELKVPAGAKIADLPEHEAQGVYAATWGNAARGITGSTAANMVTTINAGNGAGTWTWEREGTAYAVLDSAGTLTLFRSTNSYTAGTGQTVTDVKGNTYTGQVYTGVENTGTSYNSAPWYNQRYSVKLARIADGQVIAPKSCAYWLFNCSNMTAFEGAEGLDTSAVTSMNSMFEGCKAMTVPPAVGSWDTSAVTNMGNMFSDCSKMTAPAVASWDTSAVTNMGNMFLNCSSMTEPPAVGGWDTSKVTNMYGMFYGCSAMTVPPAVGSWDTGAVTDMSWMFYDCSAMTVPPTVGSWNTGAVTTMSYMFSNCSKMPSLDVSGWDFSKVTSESSYLGLQNCSALRELRVPAGAKIAGLPEHEAQGVYAATWGNAERGVMGSTAANLISTVNAGNGAGTWEWEQLTPTSGTAYALLDSGGTLTLFRSTNTYSAGTGQTVTDIMGNTYTGQVYTGVENTGTSYDSAPWYGQRTSVNRARIADGQVIAPVSCAEWFSGCSNMTALEGAERLDTSKVTSMRGMFSSCSSLESLDLTGWNTSAVTDMYGMFYGSKMAEPPAVGSWNTSAVTNMGAMFSGCSAMTEPPAVGNWNTSAVTSMSNMFYNCSAMTEPPSVGGWDTSKVTDMGSMFAYCEAMTEPPSVGSWSTSAVTNMGSMFNGCSAMTEPPSVGSWDTSAVTSMSGMFYGCDKLATLDVGGWDVRKVEWMDGMFQGCSSLTSINLSGWETDSLTSIGGLFWYCTKLTYVDMRGFDTTKCPSTDRIIPPNALCITVGPKFVEEHNLTNLSKHRSWRQMETPASATTEPTVYVGTDTLLKNDVSKLFAQTDRDGIVTYGTCDMEAVKNGTEITFARVGWQATRDDALAMEAAGTTSITGTFTDLNGKQHTGTRAPVLETAAASAFPSDWDVSSINAVKFEGGYKPQFLNWQFKGMSSLTSIDWGDFSGEWLTTGTLGKIRAYRSAFEGCSSLRTLDLSRIAGMTGNATSFANTFNGCSSLENLDLTGWNTTAATDMSGMFDGMTSLTSVTLDSTFSFKGNGITDEAKMAVLPTPTGDDYTSKWVSPNRTQTLTAVELRDGYDGSTMSGTWTAEHTPTAGHAYAVFNGTTGTLTLLRSMEQHNNMTNGTVVDIRGNSYTGTIFAGLEESGTTSNANQKWSGLQSNITSARVAANQTIRPQNCAYWFARCNNMTSLSLEGLDTSATTNMRDMFRDCAALTSLDVSGLDTSHVTNMFGMFHGCKNIASIDVSSFDTSNVTDMRDMFSGCESLVTPPAVGSWNTSNVTSMWSMFSGCASLTTAPDVSKWDTSKVTDMSYLFYGCTGLTDIDASGLDMASVANMSGMFEGCSNLVTANTSGWDTSSATSMAWTFHGCGKIEELDIASWSTAAATDMEDMFDGMGSLRHIDLGPQFSFKGNGITDEAKMAVLPTPTGDDYTGKWVSPNVTGALAATELRDTYAGASMAGAWIAEGTARAGDAYSVVDKDKNLVLLRSTDGIRYENGVATIIDVKGNKYEGSIYGGLETVTTSYWTTNIKSARIAEGQIISPLQCTAWFKNRRSMTYCDLTGLDTSKITTMADMFSGCESLETLILPSDWDTSNVTSMSQMFYSCKSIQSLTLPNSTDMSKVTNMQRLFANCPSLTTITLPATWNTSAVTNMNAVFSGCKSLASIDLSQWDTSNVTNMNGMFSSCSALTNITLPDTWDTSKVTNMYGMFQGCTSLTELDLANLNTSNVTDMSQMFRNCAGLTNLTLPATWNTSNVARMSTMFSGCSSLKSLDIASLDTSAATSMGHMFDNCASLETVTLGPKFSFKGNGITSETSMAMLPTPKVNETYDGKWSRSDGRFLSTPAELRDSYDGSTMAGTYAVHEYTGTITPINPDGNGDGLGDNLSFSVPTSVNFVLDRDGSLTAPTNAAIENHSGSGLLVTSAKAEEQGGFALVEEISETGGNQAAIKFGAGAANLFASDYLTKKALSGAAWHADAAGSVGLSFEGRVKTDGVDVARVTPFGRITWYVTAAETPTGDGT